MSDIAESFKKWRTIVDGDVWFFAKPIQIKGGGIIGVYPQPSANEITFYAARGLVEASVRFKRDEADKLIQYLRECQEKAKTIEDVNAWGPDGTQIIHEMKTDRGVLVHISSLWEGRVGLKLALYDTGDEDRYFSAIAVNAHLDAEQCNMLLASLEEQLAYVDEIRAKLQKRFSN